MSRQNEVCVIDLDNCISDDKWRWPLFDLHLPLPNDRYVRYHDACDRDLYQNSFIIRELARRHRHLVVFTSRPESVRHKTESWLRKWKVPVTGLLMRPDNNHEPSTVLKCRMLTEWLDPQYKVITAIDDRVDILDMYADNGVNTCRRVFIHEPEIEHP